ncbi:MAG: hypothetical protein SGI88_09490 [Candidatus Hydrogenedentes bacterium]|nr:hypothetical protein [Candidatus Hydrogenedentota bacterium]
MNERDMNRMHDELSAFLDGEAENTDAIKDLIARDAGAAKLYAEMSVASAQLKSLAAPDVHPAFTTRVMAQVRDERAPKLDRSRRWTFARLSMAAAAGLCIAYIASEMFYAPQALPTTKAPYDGQVAQVLELRNQPDHALLTGLDGAMPEAAITGEWLESGYALTELAPDDALDQKYADVVSTFAALTSDDVAFDDDGDVYAAMEQLTDDQRRALQSLLAEYSEGGSQLL